MQEFQVILFSCPKSVRIGFLTDCLTQSLAPASHLFADFFTGRRDHSTSDAALSLPKRRGLTRRPDRASPRRGSTCHRSDSVHPATTEESDPQLPAGAGRARAPAGCTACDSGPFPIAPRGAQPRTPPAASRLPGAPRRAGGGAGVGREP